MAAERELPGIVVANFLPDEVAATVMPYVDSHLDLLPSWIVELNIFWDADESLAKMRPYVDYRRGKLTIGSGWIESTNKMRRRTIMHEFMHMQLGPLHAMAVRILDIAGKGNEPLDTELRETFRIALEQTTVDMTALVERLVDQIDRIDRTLPVTTTPASSESARSRVGPAIAHSNGAAP